MEGKTPDQGATSQGWALEGSAGPLTPGAQGGQCNHAGLLDQGVTDQELTARELTNQGLADLGMDWLQDMQPEVVQAWEGPGTFGAPADEGPEFGEVAVGRGGWAIKVSTVEAYQRRANTLWRAAAERKARLAGDPDAPALIKPIEVVEYLNWRLQPQPGLSPLEESTWRAYRSALLWDFSRTKDPEFDLACKELERLKEPRPPQGASDIDGAWLGDEAITRGPNKRHGIRPADLVRLVDQLGAMNRHKKWGVRTQYWIQAGIATGLRPGEWQHARWADEAMNLLIAPTLKVKASPAAYARAGRDAADQVNDQEAPRSLPLRAIAVDSADQMYVEGHLLCIREALATGMSFKAYQNYCRHTLWRACRQLWGGKKLYSLYNARHQFSANARGKLSPDELANVMGHVRRANTSRDYADARHAYRRKGGVTDRVGDRLGNKSQEGLAQVELSQAAAPETSLSQSQEVAASEGAQTLAAVSVAGS
jgi:hypothetical protein